MRLVLLQALGRSSGSAQNRDYSSRDILKADALIVASARAANVSCFYSHDENCRALAELTGMKAEDLPVARTLEDQYLLTDIKAGKI